MITFQEVRRKILVVDDEPKTVEMILRALRGLEFDFLTATNGDEAIRKIRCEGPDIVLLDLNLPDIDGRAVLKRIKEIDEDIGVIVITGYGSERTAIDLMKLGAMDFISKPFDIHLLRKSITDTLIIHDAKIEHKRQEILPSLEKFFPFLAHEIRTPLQAIEGAIAVIQRRIDLKDEILSRSVKIIHSEVEHLSGFVGDCLDFVRHPAEGYFTKGQINDIILFVMDTISHVCADLYKNTVITYQLDPHLPEISVNYEEIKQAFLNLVRNALESMPNGGELIIDTKLKSEPEGKFISIEFRDHGIGVRHEHLKRILSPFFTTKVRGSGLGLPICHRIIVERHNGKLNIESEEGRGTKVVVELPFHQQITREETGKGHAINLSC